ncbi:LEPR-XLL domain-containing protein [Flagellimonas marinaquae]
MDALEQKILLSAVDALVLI